MEALPPSSDHRESYRVDFSLSLKIQCKSPNDLNNSQTIVLSLESQQPI